MDTPTPKAGAEVKAYADKFLAVLERIAVALETLIAEPGGFVPEPLSTPEAGRTLDTRVSGMDPGHADPGSAPLPVIPYDEVRKAVMAYGDAKGAHAAKDVLKLFGANYLMDLMARPEKYADVLAALK